MSKTFKVHEDFDLEHLTWKDESCHCDPPGTFQRRVAWYTDFWAELITPTVVRFQSNNNIIGKLDDFLKTTLTGLVFLLFCGTFITRTPP